MATLGVTFSGAAYALRGKKTEDITQPPINAKSPQEENFVKYVFAAATRAHSFFSIIRPCRRRLVIGGNGSGAGYSFFSLLSRDVVRYARG